MAKEILEIAAVAGLGGIVAYIAGVGRKSPSQDGETVWMATYAPEPAQTRPSNVGSALAGLLGSLVKSGSQSVTVPQPSKSTVSPILARSGGVSPLLDVIGAGEGGSAGYNAYYGGIKSADAPPKPLTQMTVGEVLAWQDSIDPYYRSEAAGKYQIMEDTLREMVSRGVVSKSDRYNATTQDKLGTALLQRRGLGSYQAGQISIEQFANNIAKEWAGAPVVTGENAGKSFYDKFNGNSATISVTDILSAIRRI